MKGMKTNKILIQDLGIEIIIHTRFFILICDYAYECKIMILDLALTECVFSLFLKKTFLFQ